MVARLFSAAARHSGPAAGGCGILLALSLVLALGALVMPACEKVPLTAPTGTVITLVASTNALPLNGSTDLTAVLIENGTAGTGANATSSAGTPVHNGTLVTFTTSLGRIEPAEARTSNGKVTVKLIADGRSGMATVKAFSGGASSDGLEVTIGAAATDSVVVSATPASVPANGGTSTISARIADVSGNPLVGIPVAFTTSTGTLTASSAVTNENGVAVTSLFPTATADVTAAAGGFTGETTVTVRSRSSITLTSPESTFEGAPASFTVDASKSTVAFSSVIIDFGDGQSRSLGAISSATTVVHFFESSGAFDVVVRGVDVDGGIAEASGSATVLPWQFSAGSGMTTSGPITTVFAFTVSGIPAAVPIDRIHWDFGDGTEAYTNNGSTTHSYNTVGVKTITVTVFPLHGDARSAAFQVRVTATTPN